MRILLFALTSVLISGYAIAREETIKSEKNLGLQIPLDDENNLQNFPPRPGGPDRRIQEQEDVEVIPVPVYRRKLVYEPVNVPVKVPVFKVKRRIYQPVVTEVPVKVKVPRFVKVPVEVPVVRNERGMPNVSGPQGGPQGQMPPNDGQQAMPTAAGAPPQEQAPATGDAQQEQPPATGDAQDAQKEQPATGDAQDAQKEQPATGDAQQEQAS